MDYSPTGPELRAAAEHAAARAGHYHALGDDWEQETYRLTDLIATEDGGKKLRAGVSARLARSMGITVAAFSQRRTARRAANGRAG